MFHAGFTDADRILDYRDTLSYDTARYAYFVAGTAPAGHKTDRQGPLVPVGCSQHR